MAPVEARIKNLMHRTRERALPIYWEVAGLKERMRVRQLLRHAPRGAARSPGERLKIAFVIPWYGKGISGGAEAECWGLVHGARQYCPTVDGSKAMGGKDRKRKD